MSVCRSSASTLTARQRLILFSNTRVSAEEALTVPEKDITFDFLVQNDVTATHLLAACLRVLWLKQRGCTSARELRKLRFWSLHFSDSVFVADAVAAFGAEQIIAEFLTTPSDAVNLSAPGAVSALGLTPQKLLEATAGAPTEAFEALQELGSVEWESVSVRTLLDSGLRGSQLASLGLSRERAARCLGASPGLVSKLGL